MKKWMPTLFCAAFMAGLVGFAILKGEPESKAQAATSSNAPSAESNREKPAPLAPMVLIPAGEFLMGHDDGADDQKPAHRVAVAAFHMDVYEVTQQFYERQTGQNPSKHVLAEHPVERVTWQKAAQFCNARSRAEGLTPCYDEQTWACDFSASGYRLPTEAEWEYACRAGSTTTFFFGHDKKQLGDYAWTLENSGGSPHPVGRKKANPWGLHDILGNVWEWVHDPYDAGYYAHSPAADPRGPGKGWRAMRGGSWTDRYKACRSAERKYNDDPDQTVVCANYDMYGFRCVRRAANGSAQP